MAIKTSWRRLVIFSQVAAAYLKDNPGDSKLKYAIERVLAQLARPQEWVNAKLSDIDIDHCSVDERDNILRDAHDNLQFTKDNLKKRNAARNALLDTEDVEVEPYFATSVPDGLSVQEQEAFEGLVIKPQAKSAS